MFAGTRGITLVLGSTNLFSIAQISWISGTFCCLHMVRSWPERLSQMKLNVTSHF